MSCPILAENKQERSPHSFDNTSIISGRGLSLSPPLKGNEHRSKQLSGTTALTSPTPAFEKRRHNIHYINDLTNSHDLFAQLKIDNDDAYLHFAPEYEFQQELAASKPDLFPTTASTLLHDPSLVLDVDSIRTSKTPQIKLPSITDKSHIHVKATPRTKTVAGKKGKAKEIAEPEDDPQWEARMKDIIVRDRNLHLRILRYEVSRRSIRLALLTWDQSS